MRRARIGNLRRRLYIKDILAKSRVLYGVEIWGWERWAEMEKAQTKFVKMAMGLDRNTPDYIWKMEAGRNDIEIEARNRANKYLLEISDMDENSLPKMCLKEELRGLKNGNSSSWCRKVREALREVGDVETLDWIYKGIRREEVEKNLEKGLKIKRDQEIQKN